MDQIVTLETAKLARKVGYDGKFLYQYINGEDSPTPNMMFNDEYGIDVDDLDLDADQPECCDIPAPTQTALSKWLREKHDMYVSVEIMAFKKGWSVDVISISREVVCAKARCFDTYEEALEGGLKQACKIVKNREGK